MARKARDTQEQVAEVVVEGAVEVAVEGQEQVVAETVEEQAQETNTGAEFVTETAETDTNPAGAPSAEEAAAEAKDTRKWHLEDGTEVSKSEFIRHQFTKNNLSRKAISEQFDINYRTVYGATVNMVNEAEPATRGRTATSSKITVSAAGQVITVIEGVYHLDNVAVEDAVGIAAVEGTPEVANEDGTTTPAVEPAVEVDRNTWIKAQVANGRDRSEIAKALGLSYGVIYGMTKEIAGTTQRHEFTVEKQDGSGEMETITRSEHIRRLFASGMGKSEIAKTLGVDYPVVWSALKGQKGDDEKYAEAVEKLSKFADKVVDAAAFTALIEQLKLVEFKQPEVPAETPAEETVEAAATEEVAETPTDAVPADEAAQA